MRIRASYESWSRIEIVFQMKHEGTGLPVVHIASEILPEHNVRLYPWLRATFHEKFKNKFSCTISELPMNITKLREQPS